MVCEEDTKVEKVMCELSYAVWVVGCVVQLARARKCVAATDRYKALVIRLLQSCQAWMFVVVVVVVAHDRS